MVRRYEFHRIKPMQIVDATREQLPAIVRIAEKQLGQAYIDLDLLLNPDTIVVVAIIEGRVVGFCSGFKMTRTELYSRIPQLAAARLRRFEVLDEIGYVASIATDPMEQGRGVATELLSHCVARLQSSSLPAVVMTGWKSSAGIHIKSLALRIGFDEVMEVENFWHDDSLREDYRCPECGDPPCKCSAVVFAK